MKNVIVSSAQSSDGWIFTDQDGNSINIGGDMKSIRFSEEIRFNEDNNLWDKYCEFHQEFKGGKSYFDTCKQK